MSRPINPAVSRALEPTGGERLAKRVAALKNCSRSEAEQYIEGGWVRVDGVVVEAPQFRVARQTVEVDPQASLLELAPVTLLLHKPPGVDYGLAPPAAPRQQPFAQRLLSAASHALADSAGTRVLQRHFARLSAGPALETGASGLVVFTQDWRVARKLAEDAGSMEHELMVEVAGEVTPDTLLRLNRRQDVRGQPLPTFKASISSAGDQATRLRFAVKGAHPGLLAYVCEQAGLRVQGMKRLRIGRVALAQLPAGQWRYLQAYERF